MSNEKITIRLTLNHDQANQLSRCMSSVIGGSGFEYNTKGAELHELEKLNNRLVRLMLKRHIL